MTCDARGSGEKRPTFRGFAQPTTGMSSRETDDAAMIRANSALRPCPQFRWYDIRCARESCNGGKRGEQRAVLARRSGARLSRQGLVGQRRCQRFGVAGQSCIASFHNPTRISAQCIGRVVERDVGFWGFGAEMRRPSRPPDAVVQHSRRQVPLNRHPLSPVRVTRPRCSRGIFIPTHPHDPDGGADSLSGNPCSQYRWGPQRRLARLPV